jgi:nucleotide-binding universal stress UspA family protein
MYDNILYPTDGSKGAEAVMDHARDLASQYDATLHVLYVVDAEHVESGMAPRHKRVEERVTGMMKRDEETAGKGHMSQHNEEFLEAIEERGHELTDAVASELAEGGVETVAAVRDGEPHQVITEYAEEADIDLIMMGTHGRRGMRRRLIGSVTEKVVRTSDRPVMTVRLSE